MSDEKRLAGWIDVWWQAIDDFSELLEELAEVDWAKPTDLAGWTVHDVAAHTAHLEAVLAGAPEETIDIGEPEHVTGLMGLYTEQGVVARRERSPDELINEIRQSTTKRRTELLDDPPTDGTAKPSLVFGGVPWDWNTLLRNRPLDVWMHEQDIRRATGRPGSMDSVAAEHTTDYMLDALGVVVGKRVAPAAATTVVLAVAGSDERAVSVGDDGRAHPVEVPWNPTVRISMGREAFIVMAGGRRAPEGIEFHGDAALGQKVVDAFRTTP
ncbi:maleylpyruvate isomerase family protein [Nocardioides sp. JQ2195]|uniref:maleylpyruvate isomerase family mycothiol-dependent enzyme n=1 Tax=Nocardioides sp. JQ2195 TaxID=2592334 RepID=UPI00143E1C42|nr:maleylpyruvate isomerase family mycothiol-dependent enzyme [Nocardioides sp. JQ2195]QIX25326.1 maleylpyruvate isomerase family protein [Nocardioides sp. JQ2195]